MRWVLVASFVLCGALSLGLTALAEEPTAGPRLDHIKPTEGRRGELVTAVGSHFSTEKGAVSVTANGVRCFVARQERERIAFVLPAMGLVNGSCSIEIITSGVALLTSFTVVPFKDRHE